MCGRCNRAYVAYVKWKRLRAEIDGIEIVVKYRDSLAYRDSDKELIGQCLTLNVDAPPSNHNQFVQDNFRLRFSPKATWNTDTSDTLSLMNGF